MSGSLKWFRVYSDFLNNAKICRLNFIEQRHFIGILALKSSGVLDQECPEIIMDGLVARGLGVGKKKISSLKNRLMGVALIDEYWQPLGWISRQFRSDHDATSAERQRKFREKMKKNRQTEEKRQQKGEKLEEKSYPQSDTIQQDTCESNALCNVLGNAPDTDTETDTELKNPPISPQGGEVLSQPSLLVDSEPQRPSVTVPKKNGHAHDEAFARFWEAYPRKVGKHAARQVFDKINLDPETSDRIVAAADAYRKKVAKDGTDPQYIKHPSGWLNARRWEDEQEPEKYTLHHIPTNNSAFANFAF